MARGPRASVAAGLGFGLLADALIADPAWGHPVAGIGRLAIGCERLLYRPQRIRGVWHLLAVAVPLTAATVLTDRRLAGCKRRALFQPAFMATLTWAALGSRGLTREAKLLSACLEAGDLEGARRRIPNLVGRDPELLDAPAMARAAIESVAENTADAAVGPLVWGALAGPGGVVAYRIVNTLDAMVGHHSERYEHFGYASARLDDVLGFLPARLTAALAVLLARRVAGTSAQAWRIWRRDAAAHPSPNAGPCEATFAGALGVRLGGPTVYPYGRQDRPWHGDGPDPDPLDIARSTRLSRDITLAAGVLCSVVSLARPR